MITLAVLLHISSPRNYSESWKPIPEAGWPHIYIYTHISILYIDNIMFTWKLLFHFPIEYSIKAKLRHALSNVEAHCNNWALNGRQFLALHILSPVWSHGWATGTGPGVNPNSLINLSGNCGQNRVLRFAIASSNFDLWLQAPGNMFCILLYVSVQKHRIAWVRRDHWTTWSKPPALIWVN